MFLLWQCLPLDDSLTSPQIGALPLFLHKGQLIGVNWHTMFSLLKMQTDKVQLQAAFLHCTKKNVSVNASQNKNAKGIGCTVKYYQVFESLYFFSIRHKDILLKKYIQLLQEEINSDFQTQIY